MQCRTTSYQYFLSLLNRQPPRSTLFPYTTLFRSTPRIITAATTSGPPAQREAALKQAALSEMDLEIIRHLAKGLSNKEIGALVHRSPHTVKDRLEKICAVLDVRSRTELVAEALRTGL